MMGGNEAGADNHRSSGPLAAGRWAWYVALVAVIGAVEPVVGAVRNAAAPQVGRWPAYALGVLTAGAIAAPLFAAVSWVFRREQSGLPPGDPAAMAYRPAALPAVGFVGAVLQDLPASLSEVATWAFLGLLVVLLAGAVLLQRGAGRAWSWWVAVPVGFAAALAALGGAAAVAHLVGGGRGV